jgi:hypothetical protein
LAKKIFKSYTGRRHEHAEQCRGEGAYSVDVMLNDDLATESIERRFTLTSGIGVEERTRGDGHAALE